MKVETFDLWIDPNTDFNYISIIFEQSKTYFDMLSKNQKIIRITEQEEKINFNP